MINRLKKAIKLWKLSNKSQHVQDYIESLENEDINKMPNEKEKAVFLSEMTEEEYEEYQKEELQGFKEITNKLKKITNGRL